MKEFITQVKDRLSASIFLNFQLEHPQKFMQTT